MTEKLPFPTVRRELTPPTEASPSGYERTLDGYTELVADLHETHRSLSANFRVLASSNRSLLERFAAPHIGSINAERERSGQDAVPIEQVSEHFLLGLAEPDFKEYMPTNPEDEQQRDEWETFKASFGNPIIGRKLEQFYVLHAKTDELQRDQQLMEEWDEHRGERIGVVMAATKWERAHADAAEFSRQAADLRLMASQSGVPLTRLEREEITTLEQLAQSVDYSVDPDVPKDEFLAELDRRDRQRAKRELDSGLLMTDQMKQIIKEALPAIVRGEFTLFEGETGGAKTALAFFISRHLLHKEPEFIAMNEEVTVHQLMGKQELTSKTASTQLDEVRQSVEEAGISWDDLSEDKKADLILGIISINKNPGSPESMFGDGPMVRAAEKGCMVIIDEGNTASVSAMNRLHYLTQLKPGMPMKVQEDSGKEVIIQPGFCIVMTANIKSARYHNANKLSVPLANRVAANRYHVRYPDAHASYTDPAIENDRLATAAVVNEAGEFPADIDAGDFDNFVRAAFVSQQVFSGNHGEGFGSYASTESRLDNKPGLDETVIAPRTMVAILQKVAGSHGEISLKAACTRFLDGVKNLDDKKVLAKILSGHILLEKEL